MSNESYDYIIVGSGSGGAALADALVEDGRYSVLLLESGADDRWIWTRIPAGVFYLLRGDRALSRFFTEPEPNMNRRNIFWPRGHVVGGSSTVNGMIWVHGDPAEFDHWRDAFGLPGWGFDDLAPLFRRLETYAPGNPAHRGTDGPVTITEFSPHAPLMDAFIEACVTTGIPATADYNAGGYEGVGYLQFNTKRGWRQGTRETFLKRAQRSPKLRMLTGAHVGRVTFDGRQATGVVYTRHGQTCTVAARKEVILCAGAVQTPQIMELSGIGQAARLKAHGVDVVHDLPGVGENAHDHLHTRLSYRCRDAVTLNQIMRNPIRKGLMAARFALLGNGLMSCSGQISHALLKSSAELPQPDIKIQLHWLSSPDARDPKSLVLDDHPGISIGTFPLRPKSRGSVHIRSADPMESPAISANYLAHPDDVATTLAAIRIARDVAAQPALQRFGVEEMRPGPEMETDKDLLDFVRQSAQTSYHPVGTCRMGTDPDAVVGPDLKVRGVENLRIADASVFPTMCSANTNAASMAVGLKAAEVLLQS
ncbi:GMC oxidoreductase [Rhodophyticola sp. CCM32]|uniref:GMC family oxidoreductase n=1 Tax=Rhodophyticola sp. CCM32 TaxID=2916397 RepID=UPI00107F7B69|nr:GMC family oxidoreductase N-terminal domain-containing protein [Rhodophyticola sp. CCM32]QBX99789.1 GMC oxidoreductase [Rhodophyticola sp. CCM32]